MILLDFSFLVFNVITLTGTVNTFIAKLELWHGRLPENIAMQFHRYSEVLVTVNDETICCRMKSHISEHLENLIDEFKRYFPDVVNEYTLLTLNPFRCEVKDVQLDMQEEFIELTNSSSDKDIQETHDLVTFWLAMRNNYPIMQVLLPFSSPYLCESAFSTVISIKSKNRNKLSNVEADLRCAVSNPIKPRMKQLVATKQKRKSH